MNKTKPIKSIGKFGEMVRKFALLITVIILWVFFSLMQEKFLTGDNIINILRQASIMGILAVGLTMVVVAGEIDMSFGANSSLAAIISLVLVIDGMDVPFVWLIVLILSTFIGAINALIVVKFRVPAMLGTIGSWLFIQGIVAWIADGRTIWTSNYPSLYEFLGRGKLFDIIPMPIISLIVVCALGIVLLNFTVLGRYFYAVGGNQEAATHAGINTNKIKTISFLILGFLAGIAGLTMASMFASATPTIGQQFFFSAIIAVFLGSIFLKDGVPNIWGTVLAAIFLALINNGFNMIGLMWWHENVAQGLIMILAITLIILLGKKKIKGIDL